MTSYSIVVYTETNCKGEQEESVEVVPTNWIHGQECFWPPYASTSKIKTAVKRCELPNPVTWRSFPVRELQTYDSYKQAREQLSTAEYTSDLNNPDEIDYGRRNRDVSQTPMTVPQPSTFFFSEVNEYQHDIQNNAGSSFEIQSSVARLNFTEDAEFRSTVLRLLKNMELLIKSQSESIQLVVNTLLSMHSTNNTGDDDSALSLAIQLPMKSYEEVDILENTISNSPPQFNKLVSTLQFLGGSPMKVAADYILKELMIDDLASTFSYKGARKKNSFSSFKEINNAILKALKHRKELSVTKESMKEAFTLSLKKVADRVSERNKKKTLALNNPDTT